MNVRSSRGQKVNSPRHRLVLRGRISACLLRHGSNPPGDLGLAESPSITTLAVMAEERGAGGQLVTVHLHLHPPWRRAGVVGQQHVNGWVTVH